MNYTDGYIIVEAHAGRFAREWDDVAECAAFHHVHPATIKELICTGNPLPSSLKKITFDLDPSCPWDVVEERKDSNRNRRTRYQLVYNGKTPHRPFKDKGHGGS